MRRLSKRRGLGRATRAAPPAIPGSASRSPIQGLRALGVPQASLDSFAWEFRQGMAARAKALGDTGESSPEHWEKPLGTADVHVVLAAVAPSTEQLEAALERARKAYEELAGSRRSGGRTATRCPPRRSRSGSGTASAIPAIEGSGIPGSNPQRGAAQGGRVRARLSRRDGRLPPMPAARGAGPQRHLRGLPQAAPARGGVSAVPEGQRHRARRRRSCWRRR